ncbi:MAG: HAMP domain-containing protein [Nitrospirae bacterium]|nr:HAMP domain-containing protein [Nitrospirota bacterium]
MKKPILIVLGIIGFVAIASLVELFFVSIEASLSKKLIFFLLLNINIAGLLVLMFFVLRSLRDLYMERKRKVPGYRFKTKVVLFFVVLTAIPSVLLFLTASGLGTNYIERLFSPSMRKPVEESFEIAKALYEFERKRALEYAEMARQGISLPPSYKVIRLREMPSDATDPVRTAFSGSSSVEVISFKGKDMVRAVVPSKQEGVIVVESFIPSDISENVQRIKETYEDYIQIESWSMPIKLNFLLILGFSSLMIIFLSIWASLRIAGRITEPVTYLAEATEKVAGGDLSVRVKETKSKDEIGLLITSFNRMVEEISEGKESLQGALTESDRRRLYLENILGNIQSGVIFLDAKGRVATINLSALNILGLSKDDVIGKDYSSILEGIDSEELKAFIKDINLFTLKAVEKEVTLSIGSRNIILRVSLTGLRDSGEGHLGVLVVFDDLTNLIKAQRVLAWQEVARRIAHEIKNPLTPIRLSTERMLKKWLEKDKDFSQIFERSTNTIIKEVEGLKRLVDEFSRFGKMPEIKKHPSRIKPVIEEVASLYRAYKNLSITIEGNDAIAEVDVEQFKRVFMNLFDNAVSAMEEGGNIRVMVKTDYAENRLHLDVADDGPGIKDEDKERLFLPYFSTKKHGTGLGLAIADRIIAEHGGSIRVSDNKPHGSVFIVELPIKEVLNV